MSETERAIEWFEHQNKAYSGKEAYQEDFRMNCVAIAALREKQERKKGCECCNGFHPEILGEKIYVWSVYYTEVGNGGLHYIRAKYCPMCGRKLEGHP